MEDGWEERLVCRMAVQCSPSPSVSASAQAGPVPIPTTPPFSSAFFLPLSKAVRSRGTQQKGTFDQVMGCAAVRRITGSFLEKECTAENTRKPETGNFWKNGLDGGRY